MKLTIVAITIAVVAGLLLGGRLSNLATANVRWSVLALIGLALQVLPIPGRRLPLAMLFLSFAVLLIFALANLGLPGFALILLGLAMNASVIAANGGMPVTRSALVASGQQDTLALLVNGGGVKHHLASHSDVLLPLADVIPVPGVQQAASPGDVATYTGLIWLILWFMRRGAAQPEAGARRWSTRREGAHVAS